MDTQQPPAARPLVKEMGGPAAVARLCGVSTASVSMWRAIPPQYVLRLEEWSGVSRSRLRPDLYPEGL